MDTAESINVRDAQTAMGEEVAMPLLDDPVVDAVEGKDTSSQPKRAKRTGQPEGRPTKHAKKEPYTERGLKGTAMPTTPKRSVPKTSGPLPSPIPPGHYVGKRYSRRQAEKYTRGQSFNPRWMTFRRGRVTASKVAAIMSAADEKREEKRVTRMRRIADQILNPRKAYGKALQYGLDNEPVAMRHYIETLPSAYNMDDKCG
jgi:hypothetical protein